MYALCLLILGALDHKTYIQLLLWFNDHPSFLVNVILHDLINRRDHRPRCKWWPQLVLTEVTVNAKSSLRNKHPLSCTSMFRLTRSKFVRRSSSILNCKSAHPLAYRRILFLLQSRVLWGKCKKFLNLTQQLPRLTNPLSNEVGYSHG